MTYLDDYRARLNHFGENNREKTIEATKQSVNNAFSDNPSFKQIEINEAPVDSIINKTAKSNIKTVLFRPDTSYEIGNIVTMDNKTYIIIDFQENDVYPTAKIQLCNNTLPIPQPDIKEIIGYDDMYNPIYGPPQHQPDLLYPCIINGIDDSMADNISQSIAYTTTDVSLTVQNSHNLNATLLDKTFTMFGNTYHIYGFQYDKTFDNDKGLLVVLAHNTASEAGGSP